ncbi:hypothetical protein EW146_g5781 [Bondarzewia mesenterica]|uniref:Polyketide synthase phosphopantetheine-binding domain-containing protein n=1 Tax=Bondarzewia mesenterica TaxID=1095465 RepID=A0A4S4LQG1_9AGAM|nr:hypothetical protein EW146_g5781 [Bondarzewia mesenterica]
MTSVLTRVARPLPTVPRTQALNSSTFSVPPLDGSLTIPEIYEWQAKHSPNHPVFSYVDTDHSIKNLSWGEVVPAMHRAAGIMRKELHDKTAGQSVHKFVVAILAASDSITYCTLVAGLQVAGYIAFPISHRNSPAAVAHLLNKMAVSHVIVSPEYTPLVDEALKLLKQDYASASTPTSSRPPVFEDLYAPGPDSKFDAVTYQKPDWETPAMIIHSSGSTAFPKPIVWTHGHVVLMSTIPYYGERDLTGMRMASHSLPMFHTMGSLAMFWTATTGSVLTVFKPQSPTQKPAIDDVFKAVVESKSNVIFTVPSFIEAWSQTPKYVEEMKKLDGIIFGGGPLSKEVGDFLTSQGVTIIVLYGCTEFGVVTPTLPASVDKDWQYFKMTSVYDLVYVPNDDGHSELVVLAGRACMPCVFNATHNGVPGYATSDLFEPHPTKPGFWKIVGRSDDQIMHNTGEKTNPNPLEKILNHDAHVNACVMFGRGQFQAGILVEPKPEFQFDPKDQVKLAQFRNAIWPSIEKMNAFAPQHSRVFKEMILVSTPSKPFTHTAKGTVRRQATLNEYDEEIKVIYAAVDESAQVDVAPPTAWDSARTLSYVKQVVHKVMKKEISVDDDLFQHGCDSLQATWIRNTILRSLKENAGLDTRSISSSFVYQHPFIASLASFVSSVALGQTDETEQDGAARLVAMVEKYSKNFPSHVPSKPLPSKDTVVLTGTTGALGSNILALLVATPTVERVYAFNRGSSGSSLLERQKAGLAERGLDPSIATSDKVVLVEGNVTAADFGISPELRLRIRSSVTHIIHNAWPVNFNITLKSFEPQIQGLRNFIDLALQSPFQTPPRVAFTSSVGVFHDIEATKPIEEIPIAARVAVSNGYGESKWVGENVLAAAGKQTPLRPIVIRVGQLSGGLNGAWTPAEWVPSLVRSSVHLKVLPDCEGDVSWLGVHLAAAAAVDFRNAESSIVHLVHPRPVPWSTLFSALSSELKIPVIPYAEWLARLDKSAQELAGGMDADDLRHNPALKLLDWYHSAFVGGNGRNVDALGFPKLDMTRALKESPKLASPDLPMMGEADARLWVRYWKSIGFIPA